MVVRRGSNASAQSKSSKPATARSAGTRMPQFCAASMMPIVVRLLPPIRAVTGSAVRESVGADNIFIFGNTTEQINDLRTSDYQPRRIYEKNVELKLALDQIRDGYFSPDDPGRFQSIFDLLVNWGDHYLLLADYASYVATQDQVDALYRHRDQWTRKA